MDVIIAALIAAAATTIVAVVGFKTTANTTAKTVAANRKLAQDQRLWENKSALYELILADATHRQLMRDHQLRQGQYDEATDNYIKKQLEWERPNFIDYEARVRAYAS